MEEEGVGEECPICHSSQWNLMIDKNYQRKVNSIKVFCSHREKGCGWKGELADLKYHVQNCERGSTKQWY